MQLVREGSSWSGRERNCALLNVGVSNGRLQFANAGPIIGVDFPDDARAVVAVDWDQDGDLDLWLRNRTAPRLRLMANRHGDAHSKVGSVCFKLEGTTCNRDAIGSRVELVFDEPANSAGKRWIETVRAGDAFLSQSSRWVHFGLGSTGTANSRTLKAVNVTWPDGSQEMFSGVQQGARYRLKQGTGVASFVEQRPRIKLSEGLSEVPEPTALARVVLPGKVPLPPIPLTGTSSPDRFLAAEGRPLLAVFWTSTCPNSRRQLQAISNDAARFRESGFKVLAVNLDQVAKIVPAAHSADQFLDEIKFPFDRSATTNEGAAMLQHFQNALFDMHPKSVVPLTLLLDGSSNAVAIYRGSFKPKTLLADCALTQVDALAQRTLATPLAGKWFTNPATPSELAEIVGKQLFKRVPEAGMQLFERSISLAQETKRRKNLLSLLVSTRLRSAREAAASADHQSAEHHYREALRLAPKTAAVHLQFSEYLRSQGRTESAREHKSQADRLASP